jgi:hypothetical protein
LLKWLRQYSSIHKVVANLVPEAEMDYYTAITYFNSLSSPNRRKA